MLLCQEANGLRVYVMDTSELAGERFEEALGQVSGERREKVLGLRRAEDRALSLAAGLLLKEGLKDYGLDGGEVRIRLGKYGKPCLAGEPAPFFNLSHSGTKALAAFAGVPVGCDIERVRAWGGGLERIARRSFHPAEYAYLMEVPEADRPVRFCRIWTLKESYGKATGRGLLESFCSFQVFRDGSPVRSLRTEERCFSFYEAAVEGYHAAVCLQKSHNSPNSGMGCSWWPSETMI